MSKSNEHTKHLWAELISEKPSEIKIRQLVNQGAQIKGDFLIELMYLIYPPDTWTQRRGRGLDLNFVNLLIELGADLNFKSNGVNCLWAACNTYNPDLVELLLRKGSNPNCVSKKDNQSTLDWAHSLLDLETTIYHRSCDKPLQEIVELLEKYGAKSLSELIC